MVKKRILTQWSPKMVSENDFQKCSQRMVSENGLRHFFPPTQAEECLDAATLAIRTLCRLDVEEAAEDGTVGPTLYTICMELRVRLGSSVQENESYNKLVKRSIDLAPNIGITLVNSRAKMRKATTQTMVSTNGLKQLSQKMVSKMISKSCLRKWSPKMISKNGFRKWSHK